MNWSSVRTGCYASAVVLALLSAWGCVRDHREDPVNADWRGVQSVFDRLEKCEMDFRVAAAAAAGRPDSEKLQVAREMLRRKFRLQGDLQDEMRRTSTALASRPAPARASYRAYLTQQIDRWRAIQDASQPAAESLGLQKYDAELKAYGAQLAREGKRP